MIAILPPEKSKELMRSKIEAWRKQKEKKALEAKLRGGKAAEAKAEAEKAKPESEVIETGARTWKQLTPDERRRINDFHHTAVIMDYRRIKAFNNALARGMDVNVTNKTGQTALMLVSEYNRKEAAELLIQNGGDVNARDNDGKTALMYSIDGSCNMFDDSPIVEMAGLLIENGADVNARDNNGGTALMDAVRIIRHKTARFLISNGADVNARNDEGKSALDYASEANDRDIIKLLKKHGATG